jgi:hypothetical protein
VEHYRDAGLVEEDVQLNRTGRQSAAREIRRENKGEQRRVETMP